ACTPNQTQTSYEPVGVRCVYLLSHMGKHGRGAGAQDSGSKSKKKKTNQNGSVRDVQARGAAAPVAATEAIHNKGKGKNRGKDGGESKTVAREETKQHDVDG
ncbi:unnamed protein product, partial [Pylaiella littoralis]